MSKKKKPRGKNSVCECMHVSVRACTCVFYCDGYGMHHQWWNQTGLTWWWLAITSHKDTGSETYVNIRKVRNGQMPVPMERCSQCGCWRNIRLLAQEADNLWSVPWTLTVSLYLDFLQCWGLKLGHHGCKTNALLLIPHCRILIELSFLTNSLC